MVDLLSYPWSVRRSWGTTARWDDAVAWRSVRVTPPASEPVALAYVRDSVLRVANGTVDDDFITSAIKVARETYEEDTGKAAIRQTWQLILDRFPWSADPYAIELPRPPLIAVESIVYVDGDGESQTLTGSPADFVTVPSGQYTPGKVRPLSGASWPSTRSQDDAVVITYTAGYEDADDVPEMVKAGIGLLVAELYKQRSLSVNGSMTPAVLDTKRFWKRMYP